MENKDRNDLSSLEQALDTSHPLCRLSKKINWKKIEKHFSKHHSKYGRKNKEVRLMVGLYYLKCAFNVSDEVLLATWLENPYWQYFCGAEEFQHCFPLDRSTLVKWRRSMDSKKFDKLLEETIDLGIDLGVLRASDTKKVVVDTTVMDKAIAFPTDIRMCHNAREKLVTLAKRYGIKFRQSYIRKSKQHLFKYGRYRHAGQYKRANKEMKKVKNYLGRIIRDIERNLPCGEKIPEVMQNMLRQGKRLYLQKKRDKNKLYSLHMPEVECIAKGKSHKKYEFGCKVGVVASLRTNFVLSSQAFHNNPYDGHTLKKSLSHAETLSKCSIEEVFVDQGYAGHGVDTSDVIIVNWKKKHISSSQKKKMKRRSAIEPVIGHMKNDFGHFRNHFWGKHGDRVAAVCLGVGFNLRKLFKQLNVGRKLVKGLPDYNFFPA